MKWGGPGAVLCDGCHPLWRLFKTTQIHELYANAVLGHMTFLSNSTILVISGDRNNLPKLVMYMRVQRWRPNLFWVTQNSSWYQSKLSILQNS